jgi:hypothetical protein
MIIHLSTGSVGRIQAPERTFHAPGLEENALQYARDCGTKLRCKKPYFDTFGGEQLCSACSQPLPYDVHHFFELGSSLR